MTITITCQYTGVAFEATSKRQKNHPRVSALLTDAARAGTYRTVVDRLAEAREAGMTDLDAIIEYARNGERTYLDARRAQREQAARDEEGRRQIRKARERTNQVLREHGYLWVNLGFASEEDADFYAGFASATIGPDWHLFRDNGHGPETTVREAMTEIAQTDVRAREWLAAHQEPPR